MFALTAKTPTFLTLTRKVKILSDIRQSTNMNLMGEVLPMEANLDNIDVGFTLASGRNSVTLLPLHHIHKGRKVGHFQSDQSLLYMEQAFGGIETVPLQVVRDG